MTDSRRRNRYRRSSLDSSLDLQAASDCLVVVITTSNDRTLAMVTSFHVRFDLQPTRHSLVVIAADSASFHVRIDFHAYGLLS